MSLKYGLNVKKKAPPAPQRRGVFDDEDGDDDEDNSNQAQNAETAIEELSTSQSRQPGKPAARDNARISKVTTQQPPSRTNGPPTIGLHARASAKDKDDEDDNATRQDLSSLQAAAAKIKAAEAADAAIFDYDAFHDAKSRVDSAKAAAAQQDARERKPKYIGNLLDAAARRKQDQLVAREKLLQREREAEGDEFADKEKFVTSAYKEQQEETRRLEAEEERAKAAEEERRRRTGGGSGMQSFYRGMLAQTERQHREAVEAAEKQEAEQRNQQGGRAAAHDNDNDNNDAGNPRTDAQLAAEMRAKGVLVHLNDEGAITDKRQLLSAGLNVGTAGRSARGGADHLRASNQPRVSAFASRGSGAAGSSSSQQAQRERQSRMMEEQLAEKAKRARDEEDAERARLERAAKSSKTAQDVSDAKARYLARKAARERGDG